MAKPKVSLVKAAQATTTTIEEKEKLEPITDKELLERCPKALLATFKKAKTPGERADLYRQADDAYKAAKKVADEIDSFRGGLSRWFLENLPKLKVTGVTGKKDRVEIVERDKVYVEDWSSFFAWVRKNNAFEFFKKEVMLTPAKERWEAGKKIPGISRGVVRKISLTKK